MGPSVGECGQGPGANGRLPALFIQARQIQATLTVHVNLSSPFFVPP